MVGRLLEIRGLSQGKEAAKILGISAADLSNRKKRGTLLPLLIEWALKEKLNLHWFITGEKTEKEPCCFARKFKILDEAEEWLTEQVEKDPEREIWFRVEFKKAFPEWEKWKEEKEESEAQEDCPPSRKVA